MKVLSRISLLFFGLSSAGAMAADIEWSGLYRVEGVSRYKPDLANGDRGIDYGLQHLILRPKIIASDGFTIRSQFDVFNNSDYPQSHLGQVWGSSLHKSDNGTNPPLFDRSTIHSGDGSNVISQTGSAGDIEVTQLYLTWDHEFGSLIVGRAPLQFGLGMTYSAGMGMFDHFYNTLDMVGYKVVLGNIFVMPMIGKSSGGALDRNDDVHDYLVQAQYDAPENDVELGVMYHLKNSNDQGSDAPITDASGNSILGGTGASYSSVNIQTINVYALKDTPSFRLGAEFGFQNGQIGVQSNAGDHVGINSFGIALEMEYRPLESSWKYGIKAGYATGDDPTTQGTYEGFIFNRNYDVAFLLFNHQLGQFDVFRTRLIGGGGGSPNYTSSASTQNEISSPDIDAISNVMYFAPYTVWKMSDRWNMKGVLATGFLNVDPTGSLTSAGTGSKDVGWEFDYSINFTPRKGIAWLNEVGVLVPGHAFSGSSTQNFQTSNSYGFQTRAAISF
jgi:hypothetical protein